MQTGIFCESAKVRKANILEMRFLLKGYAIPENDGIKTIFGVNYK